MVDRWISQFEDAVFQSVCSGVDESRLHPVWLRSLVMWLASFCLVYISMRGVRGDGLPCRPHHSLQVSFVPLCAAAEPHSAAVGQDALFF